MDLGVIIQRFIDEDGNIVLPQNFTIPALTEMLYFMGAQMGNIDDTNIRYWDYSESAEGTVVEYSRREVNTRIKAVAARLMQVGEPGDRVAILASNSPEYLFGFMGAMYASQVPIPLYDPNEPGHGEHLKAVLADSAAKTVLTNKAGAPAVRAFFADLPAAERPRILLVDSLPDSLAESWEPLETAEGTDTALDTSFLQYTSGSTRMPAGVVLTNESIVTNVIQIYTAGKLKQPLRGAIWLPLHHDMGIIVSMLLVVLGNEVELMAPRDFIQQPKRFIKQLARRADEPNDMHVYSVIPNFALDVAARYAPVTESDDIDLSVVEGLIIGSESVTQAGVDTFMKAFEGAGLRRDSLRPGYGLAEATLIVSLADEPRFTKFDREQLALGRAVEAEDGLSMASTGHPVRWMNFAIVDPETRNELEDGSIGEIWIHGANVAGGYLDREEETQEAFDNSINETLREGLPRDSWLATGDLGTVYNGEVYITGRLKELVVIAGRNHYPQDIEATVMESTDHVRADSVAAFAIPGEDVERLVLFVERADDASPEGDLAAEDTIRAAVTTKHGVSPDVVEFYAPNEIARSSSGKIARRVNMQKYLNR
ncbi:FadD32-like long-chain-fatty-acid--AMP ligase [Corynebacterium sanguinis]|uniref:FadD32-like long-chain-fatty-acid--AMP ligase n=1 Tax=Corynebacterium sanguinis TaxID=2594913 RepID=UPI0010AACD16|nr:FadD32-like long-chain-fatty-acid--AMP ligase [Corynebacterium sanguinis]MCT1414444.1 FadD32-like long-chain-fatty-acid--AMP ligase [Corynebacterium sanguinis]MCT1425101.1 FadD32-like long-chain-fatty-acid--AMP ligase [Corynebacterium sanguinis]MCT1585364.1 FadD32-like long-chain-fatty-acid--AMP ligase [Corynebacterium sanguinis]MCT1695583.1 FadD32-like long-chain-fatty-acid--AMP ligase [Corynebacterium sanguinis]MCT1715001.1 FadD32-like long-chain-fatty-acid--AMP ligase [Corynebacterium sa